MTAVIDGAHSRRWILAFAARVAEQEAALNALDQAAGDGDFGTNIAAGVALYRQHAERSAQGSGEAEFRALAEGFLDEIGGTSGPLFGLLFLHLSEAGRSLADRVAGGLAAIQRVGSAEPGDKTLVDALQPARDALAEAGDAGPDDLLATAARAAAAGAEATAAIRARRGRASYVGERAVGVVDPGAQTVAYFFQAGADTIR
ncbi:dihydroxyacetone kinase subunit DhaL [Nonomuraea sp. NPDC050153]|uniref:dihydroxyacetone kinase subunit DhaL n=1 Tax=Nonomuraea sp. NPDC050153 TaxID=3364359 RepID=UPI0037A036E8